MRRRFLLLLPLVACTFSGAPGDLGKATFTWGQYDDVAAGSDVSVLWECVDTCSSTTLTSGSDSIATVSGTHVATHAPGFVALLLRTQDGTVVDFIHMHVVQPTSLSIAEPSAISATKTNGDLVTLHATMSGASTFLGGDYHCHWDVSDPNVAEVEGSSGVDNSARVKLVGWGVVGVTATCLGLSSSETWLVMSGSDAAALDSGEAADD